MEHIWLREAKEEYTTDNKHDKGYKYLLSMKKVFIELLRSFVKQGWVEKIDESNMVRVDKSFILQDFKGKEADLVYWVKLNDQDVVFYILMELQSTVDFQMPYRLLLYMVEIWRTLIKDSKNGRETKKDFRLPSIVPIVLFNGQNNWTACKSYKKYQSGSEWFGDNVIDFKYILIDVNRYSDEELMKISNLIASVFLVDKKQDLNCLMDNLKKVMKALKNIEPKDFDIFLNWFSNTIIKGVEPESQEKFKKIIDEREEENEMMVSNIEITLKEGYEKSRKEGLKEGLEKGIKEGKIEGILELLMEISDIPKGLEKVIKSQKNEQVLSSWLKLAAKVDTIEEFQKNM